MMHSSFGGGEFVMFVGGSLTPKFEILTNKTTIRDLHLTNVPTSSSGLASGCIWSDGGTLKIIP